MRALFLLLLALPAFAQPTITNVRTDYVAAPNGAIPHSYLRFRWNLSAQACYHRILYSRNGHSDGYIMQVNGCWTTDAGFSLSGLTASQQYNYTIESSFDNATWGSGASGSFTTGALPAIHPAPPQLGTMWAPAFPVTTGYNAVTVATDCHDLNSDISAAVTLQPSNGTVITIPNETAASAACAAISIPNDTQLVTVPISTSNINTSTGLMTPTNGTMPFTPVNGNMVRFAGGCLPGSYTQGNNDNSYNAINGGGAISCGANGQFLHNYSYFIVNASGNNFAVSKTSGGAAVVPASATEGGTLYIQQWPPQNQNWIIVQTSTPDSSFCPTGVRCMGLNPDGTPFWKPKMALIENTGGCFDCNTTGGIMNHHIWFRGLEVTTTDASALASSTIDPLPSNWILNFPYTNGSNYIVFDRCYIHGQPFPNRYAGAVVIGGSYIGFVDDDIEKFEYWRPTALPAIYNPTTGAVSPEGLSGSVTGATLTIIPGTIKAPLPQVCTAASNVTFTFTGGSASGTVYAYADSLCNPVVVAQAGATGTCTGSMTDMSSTSHPCAFLTLANAGTGRAIESSSTSLAIGTGSKTLTISSCGANYFFGVAPVTVAASSSNWMVGTVTSCTSGTLVLNVTQTGGSGTFTAWTVNLPGWPVDSYCSGVGVCGGINAFTLGQLTLSSGTLVANGNCGALYCGQQNENQSTWLSEGSQTMQTAAGPGPFTACNNYIEASGLMWHFSDDSTVDPIGVHFCQNLLFWDQTYRVGSPISNGYWYGNRNGPEWKHGRQVWYDGNVHIGNWNSVSLTGPTVLAHTADYNYPQGPNFTTQDFLFSNNSFWNVSSCIETGGGVITINGPNYAAARIKLSNNLCATNGWSQTDGNSGEAANGGGLGNAFELDNAIEDLIFDHISAALAGQSPMLWHTQSSPVEGCQMTNALLWLNQTATVINSEVAGASYTPAITGLGGTLWNQMCTNDPGTPGGIWTNNIAVPGYLNSLTSSSIVSAATLCTTMNGSSMAASPSTACTGGSPLMPVILNQTTVPLNLAQVQFQAAAAVGTNLRALQLLPASPYNSGSHAASDWTDIGVDFNALDKAQGAVGVPTVVAISATAATITIAVSDPTFVCSLDYATGANDPSTQTGGGRVTASVAGNSETFSLTGLTALTFYRYNVLCAVNTPTGGFQTSQ